MTSHAIKTTSTSGLQTLGRGSWTLCLSCICLLAMHTLICVTFSLPPGVGSSLQLLLVALPGLFYLHFFLPDRHLEVVPEGVHSRENRYHIRRATGNSPRTTTFPLRPEMTEKLLTGTLSLNTNKNYFSWSTLVTSHARKNISSTTRLFADESLVYRTIRSKKDQTLLFQEDVNKLQEWEHDWLMKFNSDKCEVIRINPLTQDNYIHSTKPLQTVKDAKYPGVTDQK